MKNKVLIVIAGPTSIGKTQLAITLGEYFKCEILSADSRQVYREMSIGTAKPNAEDLNRIPHHFIDHVSIFDPYDVGKFEVEAMQLLQRQFLQRDYAILCGGTGLYIDAVCKGLDKFPPITDDIKLQVSKFEKENGINGMLNYLKIHDQAYFNSVDQNNIRRVSRALEVIFQTGKPYSSFLLKNKDDRPFHIIKIGLNIAREKLYQRINLRVDQMIKNGLIDEAKQLYSNKHLKALDTVGYSELFEHFDSNCTLEFAIDKIKQHTRNYAKRQLTWFNKNDEYDWFDPNSVEEIKYFIKQTISELNDSN